MLIEHRNVFKKNWCPFIPVGIIVSAFAELNITSKPFIQIKEAGDSDWAYVLKKPSIVNALLKIYSGIITVRDVMPETFSFEFTYIMFPLSKEMFLAHIRMLP
ncbi:hypothetical protein RF11_01309 [Thelohanellus kitauei]|uniref:Uncharacterized protein n=1 Tax=Thelohanellus kitauei TaxID=669202 RepID=A0A0C2IKQ1_THEKT|nr:hypothetical protein RF11_01309 [Thelohanellus kitauei]